MSHAIRGFDPAGFDNSPSFDTGQAGGYWPQRTKQTEVWASQDQGTRAFDPAGFDNSPRFDTGQAGGYWRAKTKQSEIWTEV